MLECVVMLFMPATVGLAADPQPKVAVVYSAWSSYAFRDELDPVLQALGWESEKFENVRIGELVPRLGEFDLVVTTGVGNYENPQDMTPYREQWLAFLRGGGCLLITDASYGSVLEQWVGTFGEGFRLMCAMCVAHLQPGAASRLRTFADHPLLTVPNDLRPALQAQTSIWAHLASWPDGWESLVSCLDQKSLLLARPVGDGLLVVSSFYRFLGGRGQELGRALLENTWLYARQVRTGLLVTRLDWGPLAPGPGAAAVRLRNNRAEALDLQGSLSIGPAGAPAPPPHLMNVRCEPGAEAEVELPRAVLGRGPMEARLLVADRDGRALVDWQAGLTVPEAIEVNLLRQHLYPADAELQATVRLVPGATADAGTLQLEYNADGRDTQALAPGDDAAVTVRLPTAGLAEGRHSLNLRLTDAQTTFGEAGLEFFVHPEPRVGRRPDGVTLVEGRPFFPFGFYHVSWTFDAGHRLQMVRDMAAAGFNVAHVGIKGDELETFGALLDEAQRLGVYIALEFGLDPAQVIERYRDHPAILTWNPGDEPDGNGTPPAEMAARYDRFKQLDPEHLVYTTLCVPSEYATYAQGTEILSADPYPIPNGPVRVVYDSLQMASEAARPYGTSVWGILQCFGGYGGWTRPPTAPELRAMTYLALLAGVKGIIYYTYADSGWSVTEHPEQWDAARALVPEIKLLTPALLDGRFTRLADGEGDLFAGMWEYEGARYVAVVNGGNLETPFDLPVTGTEVTVPFGSDSVPTLAEGRLRGVVEGLGVRVVVVR